MFNLLQLKRNLYSGIVLRLILQNCFQIRQTIRSTSRFVVYQGWKGSPIILSPIHFLHLSTYKQFKSSVLLKTTTSI